MTGTHLVAYKRLQQRQTMTTRTMTQINAAMDQIEEQQEEIDKLLEEERALVANCN